MMRQLYNECRERLLLEPLVREISWAKALLIRFIHTPQQWVRTKAERMPKLTV